MEDSFLRSSDLVVAPHITRAEASAVQRQAGRKLLRSLFSELSGETRNFLAVQPGCLLSHLLVPVQSAETRVNYKVLGGIIMSLERGNRQSCEAGFLAFAFASPLHRRLRNGLLPSGQSR